MKYAESPSSPGQRRSSLAEAMAKAALRREQNEQMQEDLRTGAELNELLRNPENRRNPEMVMRFWTEIKRRIIRRHGTVPAAFRNLDTSGDNSMSFLEFSDMLRQLNIHMDQRVCRSIFDKAAGGDRVLSLQDLQAMLLEPTLHKLRVVLGTFSATQESVQLHIHSFLRRLNQADETSCTRAVNRFQRKLSVAFCREFGQLLVGDKSRAQMTAVDRARFSDTVWKLVQQRHFQAYEVAFMLRVFERVDSQRHRSVSFPALVTTLLLLSSDPGHMDKIALLFEVFDTDYDGCLEFDQILAMFRCICKHRPIADAAGRAHDQAFQEELAAQEGLRAYERAYWHLQRNNRIEGGIVSLDELLMTLDSQPQIMEDLMPGTVRLHWLLEARPRSAPSLLPVEEKRLLPWACPWDPARRPRTTSKRLKRELSMGSKTRSEVSLGSKPQTPCKGRTPSKPKTAGRAASPDVENAGEALKFKRTVTQNFKHCISSLGDLRLSDLNSWDGPRPEDLADDDLQRGSEAARLPSPPGTRPTSTALSRVQSAPGVGPRAFAGGRGFAGDLNLPVISPDKWGSEAADRFRLFSTIASSFGREDSHTWPRRP